jgi:hypothetical protein
VVVCGIPLGTAAYGTLVARSATTRWFHLAGVRQAGTHHSVERLVPFGLVLSLAICWYAYHGHPPRI